jgi:hypothetical protein
MQACVPHDGPFRGEPVQVDQSVFAIRAGFPSVISDSDFRTSGHRDDLRIGGSRDNSINRAVFLPQLMEYPLFAPLHPTTENNPAKNSECPSHEPGTDSPRPAVRTGDSAPDQRRYCHRE